MIVNPVPTRSGIKSGRFANRICHRGDTAAHAFVAQYYHHNNVLY